MKKAIAMALFGLGFSVTAMAADPVSDDDTARGIYGGVAAEQLGGLDYHESPEPAPVPGGSGFYRGDGPVPTPGRTDDAYGIIERWELDDSSA